LTEKLIATLKTEILHEEDTDQFNNNCIEMRKSQINLPNKIVICDSGQTQSTHRPQVQNDKCNTNPKPAVNESRTKIATEMIPRFGLLYLLFVTHSSDTNGFIFKYLCLFIYLAFIH